MTTFNDLPDEILVQIFQSIPLHLRKKERRNFMLVSKRWRTVADEAMGLEVFVGSAPWSGWEEAAGGEHMDLCRIQQVGVSICHVGELLGNEGPSAGLLDYLRSVWGKVKNLFVAPSHPQFKHAQLLHSLRFSGVIRSDYFRSLVTNMSVHNLRQLQLNHSALSLVEPAGLTSLLFQSLEFLEIMADFAYIFRNIDDSRILTNVLTLLGNQYPRLRTSNLSIPYNQRREVEITIKFFQFLHQASPTLQNVEMMYFYFFPDPDADDGENDAQVNNQEKTDLLRQVTEAASRSLRLKILLLHINIPELRCFNYWVQLLSRQEELEYLVVLSSSQIFSEGLIRRVAPTLRILLVNVDTRGSDGRPQPLDCFIFNECPSLTHFSLRGSYENFTLLATTPGLINVGMLPATIVHIDMSRIPVLSEDVRWMLLFLLNLNHFTARYIGRNGEMGVTLETLMEVIRRRRIQWFHLVGSFNGDFPAGGLSNGHPTRPTFLNMDEDSSFCIKLNRTGYYGYASAFEEIQASVLAHGHS